jgi:hypothetical protein
MGNYLLRRFVPPEHLEIEKGGILCSFFVSFTFALASLDWFPETKKPAQYAGFSSHLYSRWELPKRESPSNRLKKEKQAIYACFLVSISLVQGSLTRVINKKARAYSSDFSSYLYSRWDLNPYGLMSIGF